MKKIIWSEDVETIRREIDLLVQGKTGLVCARRGLKNNMRLPAIAKTSASSGELLVLHHPHEPSCNSDTCTFYYHRQGNPIRFFPASGSKRLAIMSALNCPSRFTTSIAENMTG